MSLQKVLRSCSNYFSNFFVSPKLGCSSNRLDPVLLDSRIASQQTRIAVLSSVLSALVRSARLYQRFVDVRSTTTKTTTNHSRGARREAYGGLSAVLHFCMPTPVSRTCTSGNSAAVYDCGNTDGVSTRIAWLGRPGGCLRPAVSPISLLLPLLLFWIFLGCSFVGSLGACVCLVVFFSINKPFGRVNFVFSCAASVDT